MINDFHLHTSFSGDCHITPSVQIEKAISLGMDRICITDHHDYDVVSDCDFTLDIPAYFPAMENLRTCYEGRIQLEIGVELGLQNHISDYLQTVSKQYPFDFIIGSNHFIDGLDPYFPLFYDGRSEREAYERFFQVSFMRVQALDCFDVLGHLDYVVRYGPNKNQEYVVTDYLEYIDPILKTLIEKGKGLECNTGGFRCGLGHPNPCEGILRRYRQLGGEILTIGSDAHQPEHVGIRFNHAADLLKDCGFRYYTVFHQRTPLFLPLP